MSARELAKILGFEDRIQVIDVGANPIDGKPPYHGIYTEDIAHVVGFEPNPQAFEKLESVKKPRDKFFMQAIGDGEVQTYNMCVAEGMSSNYDPDLEVMNRFQMYPEFSKIVETSQMETTRLDDIPDASGSDMFKIDVQGSELRIFQNAKKVLEDIVLIHTEAMFVPIYKDQPLFADQDTFLRGQGFNFHTILDVKKRAYRPLVINGDPRNGLNQICTVDVVYFASWDCLNQLPAEKLVKLAILLDQIYKSYDLAQAVLKIHEEREGSDIWNDYMNYRKFQ